jgi:DNA-directed RNA polymerase subunit beta'
VIIGRLIPAGTGYNAYEQTGTIDEYTALESTSVIDEVDDPLDMVLDDRTARAYNLDSPSLESPFGNRRGERSLLDEEDELLIADEVIDLVVEEDEEDDYEDDDEEDDYDED